MYTCTYSLQFENISSECDNLLNYIQIDAKSISQKQQEQLKQTQERTREIIERSNLLLVDGLSTKPNLQS
jgi:hypothetical protein